MASSAGAVYVDVKANTGSFEKSMSGLGSVATKIGGVIAGALSAKAIADFAMQCTEAASALTEVQNVVDQVFPTMARRMDDWSGDLIASYGLSELAGKRYASTLGSMARSMGFTEEQAYKMGTSLAELSGDIASFYDMSADEAYDKLTAIFTGVTQPLRALGINMTEASLSAFALSRGIQTAYRDMSEAERTMLRYQFVLDRTRYAQGDAARTSDTWANQLRQLSMNVDTLKATLGEGFVAALLPVLQGLNWLAVKANEAAIAFGNLRAQMLATPVGRGVSKLFAKMGSMLGFEGDQVTGVMAGVSSKASQLAMETDLAADATYGLADASSAAAGAAGAQDKATKKLNRTLAGFDRINKLAADSSSALGGSGGGGGGGGGLGGLGDDLLDTLLDVPKALDDGLTKKVVKEGFAKQFEKAVATNPIEKLRRGLSKMMGLGGKTVREVAAEKLTRKMGGGGGFTRGWGVVRDVQRGVTDLKKIIKGSFGSDLSILDAKGFVRKGNGYGFGAGLGGGAAFHVDNMDQVEQVAGLWSSITNKTAKLTAETAGKDKVEALKTPYDSIKSKTAELSAKVAAKASEVKSGWTSTVDANWKAKQATLGYKFSGSESTWKKEWSTRVSNAFASKTGDNGRPIGYRFSNTVAEWRKSWTNRVTSAFPAKTGSENGRPIGYRFSDTAAAWKESWGKRVKAAFPDQTAKINAQDNLSPAIKAANDKALKNHTARLLVTEDQVTGKINAANNTALKDHTAKLKFTPELTKSKINVYSKGASSYSLEFLAQGGYVERNTPRLAVIGDNTREGEIVSPESKFQTMLDKAAGQGGSAETVRMLGLILAAVQSIDPNVYIDSRDVTRAVVTNINRQVQSTGRSPLLV